jgi:hypothetical protein
MAEVFARAGDPVPESGTYACSDCGHRTHLTKGETMPPDHHADHPWTLMIRDEG